MSIEVRNLSFSYGHHPVLKGVSFSADYGEFVSVLGPNGAGKSTLFSCMLGLLAPSNGQTLISGEDIAKMPPQKLSKLIAYIPQTHNPVFNYTVQDMVLMGTARSVGMFGTPSDKQIAVSSDAMKTLGIEALKNRYYGNISGGERQLVLIARALAQQAKILIMDEPSASLDFGNRVRVMQTVRALTRQGYAVIQSTHDPEMAYLYSDRVLALKDGSVLAFGTPQTVMTDALMSALYDTDIQVHSLRGDTVRVCLPKEIK